jgi:hypothetical protein
MRATEFSAALSEPQFFSILGKTQAKAKILDTALNWAIPLD